MDKVQSFRWTEPAVRTRERQTQDSAPTQVTSVGQIKRLLEELPAHSRESLLQPYMERALAHYKSELEAQLARELEHKYQQEMALAIEQVHQTQNTSNQEHNQKLQALIDNLENPEFSVPKATTEQALGLGLLIAEKVLAQSLASRDTYKAWADTIVGTAIGHTEPRLSISRLDYELLQETGHLSQLQAKFGEINIKEQGRFSFELNSVDGASGHDSQAILKHIQAQLTDAGGHNDQP